MSQVHRIDHPTDFIPIDWIENQIRLGEPEANQVRDVLQKSMELKPLTVEETGVLVVHRAKGQGRIERRGVIRI